VGTSPAPSIGANDRHRFRVAFPRQFWYPACQSADLGRRPLGISLMDSPLVLFRDRNGHPRALLDRCAHRNLALSLGRVHPDGCIECAYHGWRFDGSGRCSAVPGLLADPGSATRAVPAHAATEQDGFVWVWGEPGAMPSGLPLALPSFAGPGCGQVVLACDVECSLHAAVENALDVPHTAFLHRGLFRGGSAKEITAERREVAGGVEVRYLGEPVRFGPLKKAGAGLTFDHWDRFLLPSTAQIEYRVEGFFRLTNTIVHLPLAPFRTRAWFVVRYWSRLPGAMVRPIVVAQGRRILAQDAGVLAHQTENVRRFGHVHYASTDLDVLGNAIWRLLLEGEQMSVGASGAEEAGDRGDATVTFRA
jgi:phenylpropionate dioxygenase-like ring-hydroxylating dioxygenase large terminal subunit